MYIVDREYLFDHFPFHPLKKIAVTTINKIIDFYEKDEKYQYLKELAYVFATAYFQSAGTFYPSVCEYGRGKRKKYGNPDSSTGHIYFGRGLSQLTSKDNYEKFSKILKIDLVNNPDTALEIKYSVKILMIGMRDGIFTGHKLSDYFNENCSLWVGAREIINGKNKANLIAQYAIKFYETLKYRHSSSDEDNPVNIELPDTNSVLIDSLFPHAVEIDGFVYKMGEVKAI